MERAWGLAYCCRGSCWRKSVDTFAPPCDCIAAVSWQDSQKSLCSVVIVYRTDADGNRPRYVFELKSPGVFDRIAKEIRILDGIEENAIDRMVCNSVRTRLSQYLGTELGPDVQYRILIEMGCTPTSLSTPRSETVIQ